MSNLIKKSLGFEKGSGVPNRDKVAKITFQQAIEIAKVKMQDLNARSLEAAAQMVIGSAKSMGIEYIEEVK